MPRRQINAVLQRVIKAGKFFLSYMASRRREPCAACHEKNEISLRRGNTGALYRTGAGSRLAVTEKAVGRSFFCKLGYYIIAVMIKEI